MIPQSNMSNDSQMDGRKRFKKMFDGTYTDLSMDCFSVFYLGLVPQR
jgi:hypothetical protein